MRRPSREIGAFSLSAVDLFASALGAFMIVVVLLLPYFRNLSDVEAHRREARQSLQEAVVARSRAEAARDTAAAEAEAAEAKAAEAGRRRAAAAARRDAAASASAAGETAMAACAQTRASLSIGALDIAIGVDTTASMGAEVLALRNEIGGIARVLDRISGDVRLGVVAFRDTGDAYVTRTLPLTSPSTGLSVIQDFLNSLSADGGGDCPEALDQAVAELVGLPWRDAAQRRIVVVGDAEAHAGARDAALARARAFAAAGGKLSSVFTYRTDNATCSASTAEPFYRALAAEGGGRYVDRNESVMEAVLMALLGK
ncbi:vWA domain-containing protein [Magnetospirillum sp. SS-4]|uniref:VWA domain-containing protein n=1 Tax=Magnetospirillum sp. SS-4 TaxID=2681465 RepID=UPI0013821FC2|nr:vWA domain-containing protein [Magnetospirillum sp. SS-4]CAA7617167.1 conserved hypothetical protein [Magnetospirillum sp. SS-4]